MERWWLGIVLAAGLAAPAAAQDEGCLDEGLPLSARESLCDAALLFGDGPRAELLAMRGYLRSARGELDLAEEDARAALAERPDTALAHATLAWIALHRGDIAEGARLAQTAYAYDPTALGVTEVLAWSFWHAGEYAQCMQRAEEALALDPGMPGPHLVRGACLADLDRHEEALASYEQALARGGDVAWTQSRQAWSFYSLGRYAEAQEAAVAALDANPADASALRSLIRATLELDGVEAAVAEWKVRGPAVSVSDADANGIRNTLAWNLYLAGEIEAAAEIIDAWAADHPIPAGADPNVVDTSAHIRAAQGDATAAAQLFAVVARVGGEEWEDKYRERLAALGVPVGTAGLKAALAACAALGPGCRLY
jgi:tetratricopeptide (TPR) repeat protein